MSTRIVSILRHPVGATFAGILCLLIFYIQQFPFFALVSGVVVVFLLFVWFRFFMSSTGAGRKDEAGRASSQVGYYSDYYKRRWGKIRKEEVLERMRTEPVPATVGAGANSMIVMYWNTWGKLIWSEYGEAFLGREVLVDRWAEDRDYSIMKPAAPEVLTGKHGIPAAFADDTRRQVLYGRNRVSLTVKGQKVTVADTNRFILPEDRSSNVPLLIPGTTALTSFPEEHTLVITPKNPKTFNLWITIAGMKIVTSDKTFDKIFDVYTDNPRWLESVLTENVMDRLEQFPDVRVIVDRGVLAVISMNRWISTEYLDNFASLARVFAKVAFTIEESNY